MDQQTSVKVGGFLLLVVAIPAFTSSVILNHSLSILNVLLLLLVGVALVHPLLGIPNFIDFLDFNHQEPGIVKEELKPDMQQVFTKPDIFIDNLVELRKLFLQYSDLELEPAGKGPNDIWEPVLSQQKNGFSVQVHKRRNTDFFFRVVVEFEASMAETFDFMGDISKRATWDEVAESSGTVERISHKTSINVFILIVYENQGYLAHFSKRCIGDEFYRSSRRW